MSIIPKKDPKDPWKNRRTLAYLMTIFSVIWVQEVLLIDAFVMRMDSTKAGVYLGIMTILQGFVLKMYFEAVKDCHKEDENVQAEPKK